MLVTLIALSALIASPHPSSGEADWQAVQLRIDEDVAAGRPVRVRVIVALADQQHQPIGPLPGRLGDGDAPDHNLYWGARYGVASFLRRQGYKMTRAPAPDGVLRRRVFVRKLPRRSPARGQAATAQRVVITADAYRGRDMREAIIAFRDGAERGDEHLVIFVGHNGLMDMDVEPAREPRPQPGGAVALACISRDDFGALIEASGTPLIVGTSGLMAPEGYVVDAVVRAAMAGDAAAQVRRAAARAYARFQKLPPTGAYRLFEVGPGAGQATDRRSR